MHDIPNARIIAFGYDVAVWHPWIQVSQGRLSDMLLTCLAVSLAAGTTSEKYVSGPFLKMK
jgi:hypothetical protein